MKLCINNIAEITSGYTFRSKVPENAASNIGLIQLRNLSEDYHQVEYESLVHLQENQIPGKHILKGNEVLFIAKGSQNRAVAVERFINLQLVASATFFILDPDLEKITPEFLAWAINQPAAQSYFDSTRTGTSTQNINKKALGELEILVPDFERQKQIVAIANLQKKEQKLMRLLANKRNELITTLLNISNE